MSTSAKKTLRQIIIIFVCTLISCSNITIKSETINNNNIKFEHEYELKKINKSKSSWTNLLWLFVPTAMIGGTMYAYREHPEIFKLLKPNLEEHDIKILQNIKENGNLKDLDLKEYIYKITQDEKYTQQNFLDIITKLCNLTSTNQIENLQKYYRKLKVPDKYLLLSFFEIYKKNILKIVDIPDSQNETIELLEELTQSEEFMSNELIYSNEIIKVTNGIKRSNFFELFNKTGIKSHKHRFKFNKIQNNEIKLDSVLPNYDTVLSEIGTGNNYDEPNIYNLKMICNKWFPNTYIKNSEKSSSSEIFSDFLFNKREVFVNSQFENLSRYDELIYSSRTLHISTYQFYPRFFCWLDQKAQSLGFNNGQDIANCRDINNTEKAKFKDMYGRLQSIISAFDLECYVQLVEGAGYILNCIYEYYPVVTDYNTELKIGTFNRIILPSIRDQIADECFKTLYKNQNPGYMQDAEYRTSYNYISSKILGIATVSELDTNFDGLKLQPFSILDLAKIARKHLTLEFVLREISQNSKMFNSDFQETITSWFDNFVFNKSKYELLNSMYGGKLTAEIKQIINIDICDSKKYLTKLEDLQNLKQTLEKLLSGNEVFVEELFSNVVSTVLADTDLLSEFSKHTCFTKFVNNMNNKTQLFSIAYVFKLLDEKYISF